jgi:hypothetical protein
VWLVTQFLTDCLIYIGVPFSVVKLYICWFMELNRRLTLLCDSDSWSTKWGRSLTTFRDIWVNSSFFFLLVTDILQPNIGWKFILVCISWLTCLNICDRNPNLKKETNWIIEFKIVVCITEDNPFNPRAKAPQRSDISLSAQTIRFLTE